MGPLTPDYRGNLPVLCVGLSSSTWLPGEVSHTPHPIPGEICPYKSPPTAILGTCRSRRRARPYIHPRDPKANGVVLGVTGSSWPSSWPPPPCRGLR